MAVDDTHGHMITHLLFLNFFGNNNITDLKTVADNLNQIRTDSTGHISFSRRCNMFVFFPNRADLYPTESILEVELHAGLIVLICLDCV